MTEQIQHSMAHKRFKSDMFISRLSPSNFIFINQKL